MRNYKTLLSIAGSDSSGGAGIQADIKTACAFGVYAMTVVTAVTAQNSTGVKRIEPVSPDMITSQLDAIAGDIEVDAVKMGMLPDSGCAVSVAAFLEKTRWPKNVIDPVMVSTSGFSLSEGSVTDIYKRRLFPLAEIVTPNIPEAEHFTGIEIRTEEDLRRAGAVFIKDYGCRAVLIKGGHSIRDGLCSDILFYLENGSEREEIFTHEYIESRNTHGTGCTLSSAIASSLAMGNGTVKSCRIGIGYLLDAVKYGREYLFGSPEGHGPLNHWVNQLNID